jgi:hypothetical protein
MSTPAFRIIPSRIMRAIGLGLSTGFLFTDVLVAQVIFVPVPVPVYKRPYRTQELSYQAYKNIDYWVRRLDGDPPLVRNWEKRTGEPLIRLNIYSKRWEDEFSSNRRFFVKTLHNNINVPFGLVVVDEQGKLLCTTDAQNSDCE